MVLIEAVRSLRPRLLAVDPHPLVVELARRAGLGLMVVKRELSPNLAALNRSGALNGHVPITAIVSLVAVLGSALYGYDTIAMAVERSASEESLRVNGVPVNHQYSKSLEFERLLAGLVATSIDPGLVYGSALRPYSELAIARAFATLTGYHAIVCSCNTPFRRSATAEDRWCGECAKCRFVGLVLAPYMTPSDLSGLIGRDMFAEPGQIGGFAALMDAEAKPFECVGERRESAVAMRLLSDQPAWRTSPVVAALAGPGPGYGHRAGGRRTVGPRRDTPLRPQGCRRRRRALHVVRAVTLDELSRSVSPSGGSGRRDWPWPTSSAEGRDPTAHRRSRRPGVGPGLRVARARCGRARPGFSRLGRPRHRGSLPGCQPLPARVGGGGTARHPGDHRHGTLARGLRRCPGGGRHRHQGQEHHGRPHRVDPAPAGDGGRAHRQHRRAGHRDLRPPAGRRLRGRGVLLPGRRRDGDPRGMRAHQSGPGPPRLARRRGGLLPGQAAPGRGRAAWCPGRQRGQRRGGAAHRGHPDRALFGPSGRVRADPVGRWSRPTANRWWPPTGSGCRAATISGTCAVRWPAPSSRGRAAAGRALGRAVDGFDGLPSRCRTIGHGHGLTFVDDALASNPFATAASIEAFPEAPSRSSWVAPTGGSMPGRWPRPWPGAARFPGGGTRPRRAAAHRRHRRSSRRPSAVGMVVRQADDVGEAVHVAVATTAAGGVVLFSPAAPTPEGRVGSASAAASSPRPPGSFGHDRDHRHRGNGQRGSRST